MKATTLAPMMRAIAGIPTPMPTFAPVERDPLDGAWLGGGSSVIEVEGRVVGAEACDDGVREADVAEMEVRDDAL
jgi:hypothetical protein